MYEKRNRNNKYVMTNEISHKGSSRINDQWCENSFVNILVVNVWKGRELIFVSGRRGKG